MTKTTMPQCQMCRITNSTVWAKLSGPVQDDLAEHRMPSRYQKSDVIFHEGSPCTGLYTVCTGKVKLIRTGRVGRQTIIRMLGPGATLSETDLFREDGRHGATAQAMEAVTLCFLSKPTLIGYLKGNPDMALTLVEQLSESLNKMERRVESLATKDARLRLMEFLLDMAEEEGEPHEEGTRIRLRITREEIAEVIGATLETTIRLMSVLKKEGLTADRQGHIVLLDTGQLQRRVGGAHEPAA